MRLHIREQPLLTRRPSLPFICSLFTFPTRQPRASINKGLTPTRLLSLSYVSPAHASLRPLAPRSPRVSRVEPTTLIPTVQLPVSRRPSQSRGGPFLGPDPTQLQGDHTHKEAHPLGPFSGPISGRAVSVVPYERGNPVDAPCPSSHPLPTATRDARDADAGSMEAQKTHGARSIASSSPHNYTRSGFPTEIGRSLLKNAKMRVPSVVVGGFGTRRLGGTCFMVCGYG